MPERDPQRKALGTATQDQQQLQQVSYSQNGHTDGHIEGQKFGTMILEDVADFFASLPQSSTSPYKQQEQDIFETNPQQPSTVPSPKITLLPSFKAAAAKSKHDLGFYSSYGEDGVWPGR